MSMKPVFIKRLPNKTYICDSEDRKSFQRIKATNVKDHVTPHDYTNDADKKVDMCLI